MKKLSVHKKIFLGRLFIWTLMTIVLTLSTVFIVQTCIDRYNKNEEEKLPIVADKTCSILKYETYLIKSNDTLESICKKYLENHQDSMSDVTLSRYINHISKINNIHPDYIRSGDYLRIEWLENGMIVENTIIPDKVS